jgi:hypothetical protein
MLTFTPTRLSQPHRRALGRPVSPVLSAMLAGRTFSGYNPQDMVREHQRRMRLSQLAAQRIGRQVLR